MKKIKLTSGNYALVDDDDFNYLDSWKWWENCNGYAWRQEKRGKKVTNIFLHRVINNTPAGFDTDHLNENKLDNRKANLRTATRSENMLNITLISTNTSGHRGVSWHKNSQTWRAYIVKNYSQKSLGYFKKRSDAITARKKAEKELLCV